MIVLRMSEKMRQVSILQRGISYDGNAIHRTSLRVVPAQIYKQFLTQRLALLMGDCKTAHSMEVSKLLKFCLQTLKFLGNLQHAGKASYVTVHQVKVTHHQIAKCHISALSIRHLVHSS